MMLCSCGQRVTDPADCVSLPHSAVCPRGSRVFFCFSVLLSETFSSSSGLLRDHRVSTAVTDFTPQRSEGHSELGTNTADKIRLISLQLAS